jgi:hypothetical protein
MDSGDEEDEVDRARDDRRHWEYESKEWVLLVYKHAGRLSKVLRCTLMDLARWRATPIDGRQ